MNERARLKKKDNYCIKSSLKMLCFMGGQQVSHDMQYNLFSFKYYHLIIYKCIDITLT